MDIGGHREELKAFITSLGQYPMVLGIPWLAYHDVKLSFATGRVTFDHPPCMGRCMSRSSITIQGTPPLPNPPLSPPKTVMSECQSIPSAPSVLSAPSVPPKPISISAIGAPAYVRMLRNRRGRYGKIQAYCNAARARAVPHRAAKPPAPDVYICYRVRIYHR